MIIHAGVNVRMHLHKGRKRGEKIAVQALVIATVFAFVTTAGAALAGASGYNVNDLLYQPHPFAAAAAGGSTPVPLSELHAPARVPQPGASRTEPRSAAAPTAEDRRPWVAQMPAAEPHAGRDWLGGIISELRTGLLIHDEGPFSRREEDGLDVNIEVLFASPDVLDFIWSPRPHIGANINTSGDTSQVYLGLSWEWTIWRGFFAGFSLGGAVHDGETTTIETDKKELGCRVLFRESVEAGWRFAGRHSVSLYLDHISNAKLCDANEGLENIGLRYGYRF